MARKCKCKYCGKELEVNQAYCNKKLVSNGTKTKNEYYCNELEFYTQLEEKMKEKAEWDKLHDFVKYDILHYDVAQKSGSWVSWLQDLRNGTTIGIGGRQTDTKNGYPYEIILETFKRLKEKIEFAFRTVPFKNESGKLNYMKKMIVGNIDDVYFKWKREQQFKINENKVDENLLFSQTSNPPLFGSECDSTYTMPTPKLNKNGKKDLFGFLDDEI